MTLTPEQTIGKPSQYILINLIGICSGTYIGRANKIKLRSHWQWHLSDLLFDCASPKYSRSQAFLSPTPTPMAFTGVTNDHRPSPQPTACRSPSCSLTTATGNNRVQIYIGQLLDLYSPWWSSLSRTQTFLVMSVNQNLSFWHILHYSQACCVFVAMGRRARMIIIVHSRAAAHSTKFR